MRRPRGTAPGAHACGAARPFRSVDHAGAVQGLRRRTPRGRSRAGSSNVAEGDVGARAGAGGRRSWCFSSGARCRTSVAADSRGTAPSRRVRRGAAARLRLTTPPARLGPCAICWAISHRGGAGVRVAGAGGRRPDLRRPRPDLRRPRPPRCTVRTVEALTALRTPPPSRSSRRWRAGSGWTTPQPRCAKRWGAPVYQHPAQPDGAEDTGGGLRQVRAVRDAEKRVRSGVGVGFGSWRRCPSTPPTSPRS